jgi:3-hydroxy-9,10-secoandrosta-1,3,5(10)-triene-9,17-dione monooxygenase reductase component
MAWFPTGVVAITGAVDGEPHGFTVGSFFSVSLEPQLIGFCVARSSSTWARLRPTGRFCVSVLAADQHHVSDTLSRPGVTDKLAAVAWESSAEGLPLISDALAWIACDLVDVHDAGDHVVAIGAVRRMAVAREERPLIFYRRGYHSTAQVSP